MSSLSEFFASVGSDSDDAVARLGGNEALVVCFVTKFLSDNSLSSLRSALECGDSEAALRAAHTLKGVSGTLSFQRLYERVSSVTELLRSGALDAARTAFPALEKEYSLVIEALKNLEQ